jgi:hypothetical protein
MRSSRGFEAVGSVARGGTLLIRSGPASDPNRKHLYVVMTDAHGPARQVLMVPICSVRPKVPHDPTCLLAADEHPFIKHESYVAYDRCDQRHVVDVEKLVANGFFIPKEPMPEAVLDRIVEGLRKSPRAKPFAREFLQDWEKARRP